MRLESGPAKADRNWQIVRAVLFLGFALWFLADGAIRWPNKNRRLAEEALKNPNLFKGQVTYDQLGERPHKADFETLLRTGPTARAQVHSALGQPHFVHQEGPGRTNEYFMSRYGYVVVSLEGDTVRAGQMRWLKWGDGAKDHDEIRAQFYWAIVPAIPGLYFLWRIYKAVTLRVVIDDEGMTYDRLRIPFAAMVSLRDYSPKGWIDLYYEQGEAERKLRLDNEKVRLFDEIVAAICQVKGFRNEVEEYAQRKAREEAEAAAAEAEAPAQESAADHQEPKA